MKPGDFRPRQRRRGVDLHIVHEQDAALDDARKYFVFRQPVIRGACLLAVVASHIPPLGVRLISFCVPVFFLLSGFHLSLNRRNERPLSFYRRTLKYLLIPYLFYSLVYAIIRAVRGATPGELWQGFLASDLEPHLWFMPAIIGLYLLHPWLRRLYRKWPAGICIAAFALGAWGWPLAKEGGLAPVGAVRTLLSCLSMIGYFVAGYFILDHVKAARWLCEQRVGRIACAVIWLAWSGLGLWPGADEIAWPIAKALAAVSVVAAFFVVAGLSRPSSMAGRWVTVWVAAFGLYSFGIYLSHTLVISVTSRIVTRLTGLGGDGLLRGSLVFALTVPAAYLLVKWLANRPLGRYIT